MPNEENNQTNQTIDYSEFLQRKKAAPMPTGKAEEKMSFPPRGSLGGVWGRMGKKQKIEIIVLAAIVVVTVFVLFLYFSQGGTPPKGVPYTPEALTAPGP